MQRAPAGEPARQRLEPCPPGQRRRRPRRLAGAGLAGRQRRERADHPPVRGAEQIERAHRIAAGVGRRLNHDRRAIRRDRRQPRDRSLIGLHAELRRRERRRERVVEHGVEAEHVVLDGSLGAARVVEAQHDDVVRGVRGGGERDARAGGIQLGGDPVEQDVARLGDAANAHDRAAVVDCQVAGLQRDRVIADREHLLAGQPQLGAGHRDERREPLVGLCDAIGDDLGQGQALRLGGLAAELARHDDRNGIAHLVAVAVDDIDREARRCRRGPRSRPICRRSRAQETHGRARHSRRGSSASGKVPAT